MTQSRNTKGRRRWKRKSASIPGYTDERAVADELGQSLCTLRKWRQLRIGPAWVRVGRYVFYPDDERAAWIRSRMVQPSAEFVAA